MEIKTKFNIGDNVWLFWNNHIIKETIFSIDISVKMCDSPEILYGISTFKSSFNEKANKLFCSKESLLSHLEELIRANIS